MWNQYVRSCTGGEVRHRRRLRSHSPWRCQVRSPPMRRRAVKCVSPLITARRTMRSTTIMWRTARSPPSWQHQRLRRRRLAWPCRISRPIPTTGDEDGLSESGDCNKVASTATRPIDGLRLTHGAVSLKANADADGRVVILRSGCTDVRSRPLEPQSRSRRSRWRARRRHCSARRRRRCRHA